MGFVETQTDVVPLKVVFHVLRAFCFLKILCEIDLSIENGFNLFLIEPLNSFAVFPEPGFRIAPRHLVQPESVLLTAKPHALIHAMIGPSVHTEAVFLVIAVLSLVAPAVLPSVDSHPLHVVVEPLALVLAAIQPGVRADAPYLILKPLSVVARPVVPRIHSHAVLLTREVKALVDASIRPRLLSLPML